jgi:hypothetical protein
MLLSGARMLILARRSTYQSPGSVCCSEPTTTISAFSSLVMRFGDGNFRFVFSAHEVRRQPIGQDSVMHHKTVGQLPCLNSTLLLHFHLYHIVVLPKFFSLLRHIRPLHCLFSLESCGYCSFLFVNGDRSVDFVLLNLDRSIDRLGG